MGKLIFISERYCLLIIRNTVMRGGSNTFDDTSGLLPLGDSF